MNYLNALGNRDFTTDQLAVHSEGCGMIARHEYSAGILACMRAKAKKTMNGVDPPSGDAAEAAALQARIPSLQSHLVKDSCPRITRMSANMSF